MFGQFAEQKEQRDRVGAARESDEQTAAGGRARAVDGLSDSLVNGVVVKSQIPNPRPKSQEIPTLRLGLGFGIRDFWMPEGRLELPTPRL